MSLEFVIFVSLSKCVILLSQVRRITVDLLHLLWRWSFPVVDEANLKGDPSLRYLSRL
jgi:hypothetical protein